MVQKRNSEKAKDKKRPSETKPVPQLPEPRLPAFPEGSLRDIGQLSFGKEVVREKSPGGLAGLELAASVSDRRQVPDTRVSPFRKVCDLVITAADGSLHSGTAWFISPRTLVTAGHCIAVFRPDTPAHGMVNKILVMPARNGETQASNSHFGWVEVGQAGLRVHDRWRSDGNLDFDYGAIILPPNFALGEQVGVFLFQDFPDQTLNGATATLSGYPDNVADGTQWFETNPIRQVTPNHLFYDIFTFGGQSGSPVFFADTTKQIACAIHNFGNVPLNSGVRITPPVVAQLNQWKA